jgi:hypothetical protein
MQFRHGTSCAALKEVATVMSDKKTPGGPQVLTHHQAPGTAPRLERDAA